MLYGGFLQDIIEQDILTAALMEQEVTRMLSEELLKAIIEQDILKVALMVKQQDVKDVLNIMDMNSVFPLTAAVDKQDLDIVKLLVEAGADPNPKCRPSPLQVAAIYNNKECVQYLISKGADMHMILGEYTAFAEVCGFITVGMLKVLLENGADLMLYDLDNIESSPLHNAVASENISLIQYMLEYHSEYMMPAIVSVFKSLVRMQSIALIELFLSHNIDPSVEYDGSSPHSVALETQSVRILYLFDQYLNNKKADTK